MKIAIVHLGNIADNLAATAVIKAIRDRDEEAHITCIVNRRVIPVYRYNKDVNKVMSFESFKRKSIKFDLLINLYPFFPREECLNISVKEAMGFGFNSECDQFSSLFFEGAESEDINMFQLYYKAAGIVWKGEGYQIGYFPKSKSHSNRVGVSVANANLRNYVLDKLELDNMKIWYVPYKKNVFKKMDEINRCKRIITDDMTVFHLSMSLRKYVYFLKTFPIGFKMELFNQGEIYEIPLNILR